MPNPDAFNFQEPYVDYTVRIAYREAETAVLIRTV